MTYILNPHHPIAKKLLAADLKKHAPLKVEFNDTEYRFNHGATPRGRGSWAFIFPNKEGKYDDAEAWFTPGSTTYGEAKKLAKAEAARRFPDAPGGAHLEVKVGS